MTSENMEAIKSGHLLNILTEDRCPTTFTVRQVAALDELLVRLERASRDLERRERMSDNAEDAIKRVEERTGEKFDLLPCPHCGHRANLAEQQRDPDTTWGGYRWEIVCSSSHCRASVSIVADGWFEQIDVKLNPGCSHNGYRDRVTTLRQMWNRRA